MLLTTWQRGTLNVYEIPGIIRVAISRYFEVRVIDLDLLSLTTWKWGQHISEISCKATKTLGFLRRNLALAPRHTKEVAYKTLVRPQLEYAAPIWQPCNETETKKKLEKVQKTAARWTCRRWRNRSSVDDMLDKLEWPSLEDRRMKSSLTFFWYSLLIRTDI